MMKLLRTSKTLIPLLLVILFSLLIISCKKKTIDLENDNYTVKELLQSKNCDTVCGEAASCEGNEVHVFGVLDENNINREQNQFFIMDKDNADYNIEVKVDQAINDVVFDKLEGQGGTTYKVTGIIQGFDAPTNFSCDRKFAISLTKPEDVLKQ